MPTFDKVKLMTITKNRKCENKALLIENVWVALIRADFVAAEIADLLAGGVLGDGLGSFTDGVLGQLTRQQETDGGLDLPGGDGASLVVVGKTAGLGRDALEDVVHEGVHDGHSLGRDSSVGVDLLQHLVDVDAVAFLSPPLLLLVAAPHSLGLAGLLCAFTGYLRCHCYFTEKWGRTDFSEFKSEKLTG